MRSTPTASGIRVTVTNDSGDIASSFVSASAPERTTRHTGDVER
jgi:hypothetical protein